MTVDLVDIEQELVELPTTCLVSIVAPPTSFGGTRKEVQTRDVGEENDVEAELHERVAGAESQPPTRRSSMKGV